MGRGRGKGKKQTVVTAREDAGSGEEEKIPTNRRRGRPQKPLKDEIEEEEEVTEKIVAEEDGDVENAKRSISNEDMKNKVAVENGRKRKRSSQVKENPDAIKEENGMRSKVIIGDSVRSIGFRQNGSRRKNKPRRAAEVGVECK